MNLFMHVQDTVGMPECLVDGGCIAMTTSVSQAEYQNHRTGLVRWMEPNKTFPSEDPSHI